SSVYPRLPTRRSSDLDDLFGPVLQKVGLGIDDRLGDTFESAVALLDRLDQPLGRFDFAFDVFFGLGIRVLLEHPQIVLRNAQLRSEEHTSELQSRENR